MKRLLTSILLVSPLLVFGQDKFNYVHFNKLTDVIGTEYVIASIENWGKSFESRSKYLLFINTKNGETNQIDFPDDAAIDKIEQVKIDNLELNLIIVAARTVDLDGKKGIEWDEPTQIFILSTDGKEKTKLTEDTFFVRTWTANAVTGTIVIAGHFDSNKNRVYDKTDKNEILIYDLKTLKLISKI